jgi:hypothetical protein
LPETTLSTLSSSFSFAFRISRWYSAPLIYFDQKLI